MCVFYAAKKQTGCSGPGWRCGVFGDLGEGGRFCKLPIMLRDAVSGSGWRHGFGGCLEVSGDTVGRCEMERWGDCGGFSSGRFSLSKNAEKHRFFNRK